MTLFKTSFWTGLSTITKLIASFIVAKVLAVYVGPVGFALIGQFQNFVGMVLTFAGNMVQTGVVKYLAEFQNNPAEKTKILSTAFVVCLMGSVICGAILLTLGQQISIFLFNTATLTWLIQLLGITLIFYILNSFLISILNGEGEIKKMTVVNMATSLVGLGITFFLAKYFGLKGALAAQVLNQSLVFFITLILICKTHWFKWQNFSQGLDKTYLNKLFKFAAMAITSGLMLPLTQIFIRDYIGDTLSWQGAGYWQAMTRISDAYLLLITSTLSVYYLPKLSSLTHRTEIFAEMKQAYKIVIPLVTLLAAAIFIFRQKIILILFSPQFLPMESLFLFQLLGDIFKIGSWLVAYNMLAKAMTRLFIFSEVIFSCSFAGLTVLFIHFYGLIGVTIAFFVNYFIYWLLMSYFFYTRFLRFSTETHTL